MTLTERKDNAAIHFRDNRVFSFRTLAKFTGKPEYEVLKSLENISTDLNKPPTLSAPRRVLCVGDFPRLVDALRVPRTPITDRTLLTNDTPTERDFQIVTTKRATIIYQFEKEAPNNIPNPSIDFEKDKPQQEARAKRIQRRELLKKHPEFRIRIDTSRLRTIIPYTSFKCSPLSSIAEDLAIKGSDIDGGIIVTDFATSLTDELAFIRELRNQGFTAYHEVEIPDFLAESTRHTNWREVLKVKFHFFHREVDVNADSQIVTFLTTTDIEYLLSSRYDSQELRLHLAGYAIE